MNGFRSALYVGKVAHKRLRPRRHALAYRVFALFLDLEELEALDLRLWIFSVDAFNLFSIRRGDYGVAGAGELRNELLAILRGEGIDIGGGRISLLTMPRVLGYAFKPLSIFFCSTPDDRPCAILYQVNNTFGERHIYLAKEENWNEGFRTHDARKCFYVSPFLAMDMTYRFRIEVPGDQFSLAIDTRDECGPILLATQNLRREPLSDRSLLRVFLTHPFVTAKVIAGIHFEALLLWIKGVPLHSRPPPPARAISRATASEKL
jgi:DUF1365 family protein